MSRLRTTLVALGVGTALIATGAVFASKALATPAPVAAVAEFGPDPMGARVGTAADTIGDATADVATPRAAARGWWNTLTDAQRSCLEDAAITRRSARSTMPSAPPCAPGSRLQDAAVSRPWGPLTKEQRQSVRADLRAAAQKCGVTLPARAATTS